MAGFVLGFFLVLLCHGYIGSAECGQVILTKYDVTGYQLVWDCEQIYTPAENLYRNPVIVTTVKSMQNARECVTVAVIELEMNQRDGTGRKRITLDTYAMYRSWTLRKCQEKDDTTLGYQYRSIRYNRISESTVEVGVFYDFEAKKHDYAGRPTYYKELCEKITYSVSADMKVTVGPPVAADCNRLRRDYHPSSTKYVLSTKS